MTATLPPRSPWVRRLLGATAAIVGVIGTLVGIVSVGLVGVGAFALLVAERGEPDERGGLGEAVFGAAFVTGLVGLFVTFLLAQLARSAYASARGRSPDRRPPPPTADPANDPAVDAGA